MNHARRRDEPMRIAARGDVDAERETFEDVRLAPVRARPRRERSNRGGFAAPRVPRTPTEWARAAASPLGAFALAAIISVSNPEFMTSGREAILMRLYERQSGEETTAYVRNGVLYRYDAATKSMTANADNGLMVDKNGGIWVIVPQKEDSTLIKQKYYMGQIEDVPSLPKNPSAEEKRRYDEYMKKIFDFNKLPDLKKVYDGPFPVPERKELQRFWASGGAPPEVMDEIEGAGALWGAPGEVPMRR